jgi:hypothetical protein
VTRRAIYIAVMSCDAATAEKLGSKHDVTPEAVREQIICRRGLFAVDTYNRNGERRVLLEIDISTSRTLRIALAVVDEREGTYELRTAFYV